MSAAADLDAPANLDATITAHADCASGRCDACHDEAQWEMWVDLLEEEAWYAIRGGSRDERDEPAKAPSPRRARPEISGDDAPEPEIVMPGEVIDGCVVADVLVGARSVVITDTVGVVHVFPVTLPVMRPRLAELAG